MEKIKFRMPISTSGSSNVVTIPKFLIHNNIIDPKKEYFITMEEVKNDTK